MSALAYVAGHVKWFNPHLGRGFLKPEGETSEDKDVFVHYISIIMVGFKKLKKNDRVKFQIIENNGLRQAINVTKVGDG